MVDGDGGALLRFVVDEDGTGVRLDVYLTERADELSRSRLRRLIDDGLVTVNGAVSKASSKLRRGDVLVVDVPPPEPAEPEPEDIPLVILHEDEHLIVVDKAAGMVVHPAPGHASGTLVNALLHHCVDLAGIGGTLRPGIVHRIDKDTSGILVVTKTDSAHKELSRQFADKEPSREYIAFVAPAPPSSSGRFETLHGRHPIHRKKFSTKVERGKRAVTEYEVVERFGKASAKVSCRLETGRTHQIRVHFADCGMPLIGDPMYGHRLRGQLGEAAARLGRQALHAAALGFAHPVTGERLEFASQLPADLLELQASLRELAP